MIAYDKQTAGAVRRNRLGADRVSADASGIDEAAPVFCYIGVGHTGAAKAAWVPDKHGAFVSQ